MMPDVTVHVEYCESCGFKSHYEELRATILDEFEDEGVGVVVDGADGRKGTFEISINGHLVFSKLKLHGFPKPPDVLAAIKKSIAGERPEEITDSASPCVIQ